MFEYSTHKTIVPVTVDKSWHFGQLSAESKMVVTFFLLKNDNRTHRQQTLKTQ